MHLRATYTQDKLFPQIVLAILTMDMSIFGHSNDLSLAVPTGVTYIIPTYPDLARMDETEELDIRADQKIGYRH